MAEAIPVAGKTIARMLGTVQVYRRQKLMLAAAFAVSLVMALCYVTSYLARVAGACRFDAPSWQQHMVIVPIAGIVGAVPLTPSGLGTTEFAIEELYKRMPGVQVMRRRWNAGRHRPARDRYRGGSHRAGVLLEQPARGAGSVRRGGTGGGDGIGKPWRQLMVERSNLCSATSRSRKSMRSSTRRIAGWRAAAVSMARSTARAGQRSWRKRGGVIRTAAQLGRLSSPGPVIFARNMLSTPLGLCGAAAIEAKRRCWRRRIELRWILRRRTIVVRLRCRRSARVRIGIRSMRQRGSQCERLLTFFTNLTDEQPLSLVRFVLFSNDVLQAFRSGIEPGSASWKPLAEREEYTRYKAVTSLAACGSV